MWASRDRTGASSASFTRIDLELLPSSITVYMYMKVHVYSTPVVEWNKKRKERKDNPYQPTLQYLATIQEYINIYRGDTWMPSLENWDGGLTCTCLLLRSF